MRLKLVLYTLLLGGATLACAIPWETPTPPPPSPSLPSSPPPLFTPSPTPSPIPTILSPLALGTPFPVSKEVINILLAGADRREGASFRTDALIIVSIRPGDRLVTLISIPRDLYVEIPDWKMQRINAAFPHGELVGYPGGGAGLLKDTILLNLGVPIDHVVMVEFDGFRRVIDALGGIEVPMACPFTEYRKVESEETGERERVLVTLGPGIVPMDGDTALWYARSRLLSNDFDRGRRQQELLRAMYAKALQRNMISQAAKLFREFEGWITTDMQIGDILRLTPLALDIRAARIRSYFIAGPLVTPWITPSGGSVLLPNEAAIEAMLEEALGPPQAEEVVKLRTTVEIWNWSPNPDWDALAAERLHYAGFRTSIFPPGGQQSETSLLYDLTGGQNPETSQELLALFGLPESSLVSLSESGRQADYRLIIGADFDPCFDPASIDR